MSSLIHAGLPIWGKILAKSKVDPGTGCWVWQAGTGAGGYAIVHEEKPSRARLAHRVAYEIWREEIPAGLTLDHLCRNKKCVNPWHCEAVTNRVNVLRGIGITARQARQTHCKNGHPLSGDNITVNKGKRYCRTCRREYQRARRASAA